jgi:hypothetical protein
VNRALRRPPTNLLAVEIQRNSANEQAPNVQSHDGQQRANVPYLNDPAIEELSHAVAPHILEDSRAH